MGDHPKPSNRKPRPILLSLHCACLIGAMTLVSLYAAMTDQYVAARIVDLVQFIGRTPFQFRLLPLLIAHGVELIHPMPLRPLLGVMGVVAVYGLLVEYGKLLYFFWPVPAARWLALAILYPVFWNYCFLNSYFYPSDLPALYFFVLGLRALLTNQSRLYWVAFVLGLMNRETICFLTVAFVIVQFGRMDLRKLCLLVLGQAVIWVAFKQMLHVAFALNPGSADLYIAHQRENTKFLHELEGSAELWLQMAATFGGIWMLVPIGWRNQPPLARRLLLIAPLLLAGMWFVGNLYEVRIYGELIPLFTTCAILGLASRFELPQSQPSAKSSSRAVAGAIATLLMPALALVTALLIDWHFPPVRNLWVWRIRHWSIVNFGGVVLSLALLVNGLLPRRKPLAAEGVGSPPEQSARLIRRRRKNRRGNLAPRRRPSMES